MNAARTPNSEVNAGLGRNRRPRRSPEPVIRRIEELADLTPKAIERRLVAEGTDEVPSLRTIWEVRKEVRSRGPIWSWREADPSEATLVLPVIAAVMAETEGDVRSVTKQTAEWIIRLRRSVPSLQPWTSYWLAVRYAAAVDHGRPTDELDDYIAAYAGGRESGAYPYSKLMRAVGDDE